jgi:hypothetical protein
VGVMRKVSRLFAGFAFALLACNSHGAVVTYGPSTYASFADSPFRGLDFSFFHLETLSPGPNAPGVGSHGSATTRTFGGLAVDGNANSFGDLHPVIFLSFFATANTPLPTHVGLVWTQGGFPRDPSIGPGDIGVLFLDTGRRIIAELEAPIPPGHAGSPGIFFGASDPDGIGGLLMFTPTLSTFGINIDHLQYGRLATRDGATLPEPATLVLAAAALLAMAGMRRPALRSGGAKSGDGRSAA